ncbi:MAG TPA: YbaN family protein [Herpetosiphonaceae bacterium]
MEQHRPPRQTPAAPDVRAAHPLARWAWMSAGFLLVGVGGLGIILPVLPTTVFFIGAAACFARSSPRFERWVLNLPRIGPLVRDYRAGLGMPRRAKRIAATTIVVVIMLSSVFIPSWTGRVAAYGIALIGIWYIMQRVPTRERVLIEREQQAAGTRPQA